MKRRMFLAACFLCLCGAGRFKKYRFKIKTKKNTTLNVTIEGYDVDNAKHRLSKRYPDCTIISTTEVK